ncbi:histidine kinase [Azoarcus sp. DD4]|uniref:HDOD domain-containing protein n=1 Tax=Azoarcus sp. DD4 TaxID=2027405 RepID=UPI00112C7765|nr:HDOD domain-containing protein [Azoarcus sp. DD4]QDF98586.1 histidine kinase [Azoarcus sp. DD4]
MSLLTRPLPSVDAYVEHFSTRPLPVLRHTVRALDALRAEIDTVSSRKIAAVVLGDPLMTMKLLTYLETHRGSAQNHDITTIDRAVMMLGLAPFFDIFSDMPTVEDTLAAYPKALLGVLKVTARARRAAGYARDWAIVRHDLDADEITVAALLSEAAEIVCWVFAPTLTQQVYTLQRADRTLRSVTAQRAVFGATAHEIQLALIHAWHLPRLLVQLLDETQSEHPRVRTIALAADFARHVAHGWDDAALPDDIAAIEALLRIGRETLLRRLGAPDEVIPRFLPANDAGTAG